MSRSLFSNWYVPGSVIIWIMFDLHYSRGHISGLSEPRARGGGGWELPPPFGRSVNPISTKGAYYSHHNVPASLRIFKLSYGLAYEWYDKDNWLVCLSKIIHTYSYITTRVGIENKVFLIVCKVTCWFRKPMMSFGKEEVEFWCVYVRVVLSSSGLKLILQMKCEISHWNWSIYKI